MEITQIRELQTTGTIRSVLRHLRILAESAQKPGNDWKYTDVINIIEIEVGLIVF